MIDRDWQREGPLRWGIEVKTDSNPLASGWGVSAIGGSAEPLVADAFLCARISVVAEWQA